MLLSELLHQLGIAFAFVISAVGHLLLHLVEACLHLGIVGEIPFTGNLKIGHNVQIGYFAQNQAQLGQKKPSIDLDECEREYLEKKKMRAE